MARTPFTQKTARFIKLDHMGKNERFEFNPQTPGKKPGHRRKRRQNARPAHSCAPSRTRMHRLVPDVCVNAHAGVEIILRHIWQTENGLTVSFSALM
jgi:hypothetical protein